MASKKDRKAVRREGTGAVGADLHKGTEVESCQRLLESGAIGARTYSGPNILGPYMTRQDKLLAEIKWVAVDVYEQRKLAVAQCRLISNMVRKYWVERSRGFLPGAASMVQSYWMSVAREIRAPLAEEAKASALFKLNTLQSVRPSGSPRSNMATPTAGGATPNGLMTPTPEEGSSEGPDKRAIAHGLVREWLNQRSEEYPPLADGTTGLADFSVQVVKHHLREDHVQLPHHSAGDSLSLVPEKSSVNLDTDFLLPIEPFISPDRDATMAAIEWAVQQNLSKRGIDALRCTEVGSFSAPVLVSPASVETQRTIFQEVVATSVMARAPHLFSLTTTSSVVPTDHPKRPPALKQRDAVETPTVVTPKHYFVSAIYSTFSCTEWSSVEDAILREAVRDCNSDSWELVSTTVNWKLKSLLGKDNLRSAIECMNRFNQLSPIEAIATDTSRRKKLVASVSNPNPPTFVPVRIRRKGELKRWKVSERNSDAEFAQIDEIETDNPFLSCRATSCPPSSANSFERRGLFALPKPPMNYFTKAFFHFPVLIKSSVHAIGAATSDRETLSYSIVAVLDEGLIASDLLARGKRKELIHSNPTVEEARYEMIESLQHIASRVVETRSNAEPLKRAFAIEEMVRKNTAAVAGNVPQYISGHMICPLHPSFVNMTRIAEMTLGRLITSVSENPQQPQVPPQQVPIPIGTLFQYCSLFRKKYPAVFTSQQKINKPSMPAPRNQSNSQQQASRIVATRPPPPPPTQKPVAPSAPASLPQTPSEPVSAPASVAASANSNWLRTSQRQKRGPSNVVSKAPPSPNPDTPTKSAENAFMVAGGPSLYGQFNEKGRQAR
jgi:hypothetical protein